MKGNNKRAGGTGGGLECRAFIVNFGPLLILHAVSSGGRIYQKTTELYPFDIEVIKHGC